MNIGVIQGIGSTANPEIVYLRGYNGDGANLAAGMPVFWSSAAADGVTFVTSAEAHVRLFAGVVEEAVGTADYTARIVAYGPVDCATWGIASNFIPGAGLYHTVAKDYLEYGSAGQLNYPLFGVSVVALETNATAALLTTKVFVRAL
jgi:hypothetical protein